MCAQVCLSNIKSRNSSFSHALKDLQQFEGFPPLFFFFYTERSLLSSGSNHFKEKIETQCRAIMLFTLHTQEILNVPLYKNILNNIAS